ncbi:MAG: polyribonucleotide nucleotidyltransferase [bacterium]
MWNEAVTIGSRTISLETGRLARQAHGSILLRDGDTVILATVTYDPAGREGLDFLPLTVDYREYFSAAGRIPGSFQRREGRSSDREVLASRLCDRSLRPLFPKGFRAETQVIATLLSYDPGSDPAVLSIIAAAAALHLSEIPWGGPLAALRVARVEGALVALPTPEQLTAADLELTLSLSGEGVVMIEGGAAQAAEADVLEAIDFARREAAGLLTLMENARSAVGREKTPLAPPPDPPPFAAQLEGIARPLLADALENREKSARRQALRQARASALESLAAPSPEEGPAQAPAARAVLDGLEAAIMRERIVSEKRRVDGRAPDAVRPIDCEVDWLPSTHGSALFTRGETQAIVTLTLGATQDRQMIDAIQGLSRERFMLHYNFPAYSVGEVRPLRGPGRREVGHGALARRALAGVLPPEADFPYTIRIVSEITESNGSSSMATVCGATLALMDGGVPISDPVAGIAMGLVAEGGELVVLSDILGDEDRLGDMDFKVAGTAQGITAVQMDNKIGSLPPAVMEAAFDQARVGRLHILAEMAKALAAPRTVHKPHVPTVATVSISPQRVRELIGPGGKVIQQIQRESETRLEVDDSGTVRIYAPTREAGDRAKMAVLEVAGSLEVGETYEAVVTGVKEFGAFVKMRGYEGLVHVSEWAAERVDKMADVANEGDSLRVKVVGTDKAGRLRLSRKEAL